MGLPVIVSSRCNVTEVKPRECGWVIEPNEFEMTDALNQYFETSAADRKRYGANGRRVVEQTYSWDSVGRQMSAVYEWLAGGDKPSDVDLRLG
jgi:glycosyltransferase involved in cell wall biosynthesis